MQIESLKDQVVLVTGASRGIGRGILQAFAEQGAIVIGTATTQAGADNISAFLSEKGYQGRGQSLNVTELESIDALIASIKSDFGPVSVLVNNAAITVDNLMLRMKEDEWQRVIDTNLTSVFRLSKAVLRDMIKKRFGRIISIGSVVGTTGNPGQANYAAAKAGVIGFSKSLAAEIASRNVTVNVVSPGFIGTDMTNALTDDQKATILNKIPMGRIGDVSDIAEAVLFLASNGASYVTGQTLHVNGGMHME